MVLYQKDLVTGRATVSYVRGSMYFPSETVSSLVSNTGGESLICGIVYHNVNTSRTVHAPGGSPRVSHVTKYFFQADSIIGIGDDDEVDIDEDGE